jgi:hypothetical protein
MYDSTTNGSVCTACGDKGQPCCRDSSPGKRSCKSTYECVSIYSDGSYVDTCTGSTATATSTATSTL